MNKQSVRKTMSVTKLTMARVKYIREHFFNIVLHEIGKRQDILNVEAMHKDTMVIEVGVEALFKAICNIMELSSVETDKAAIAEYSLPRALPETFVDKLSNYVELEHQEKEQKSSTLEDRKRAIEEYRSRQNMELSEEWDE